MIPKTSWTPTPADIAWQKMLIDKMTEHATWTVPVSQSVFEINKLYKTFKLSVGDPKHETNRRIAIVFKKLGYTEQENHTKKKPFDFSDN